MWKRYWRDRTLNEITENPDTFTYDSMVELRADALDMVSKCIECCSCYIDCAFGNYRDNAEQCKAWIRESNDFLTGKIKSISKEINIHPYRNWRVKQPVIEKAVVV